MKKLLCLILALLMLMSVVACQNVDNPPAESNDDSVAESDADLSVPESDSESDVTTDDKTDFVPSYTGEFKVGFGRVSIMPDLPAPINSGEMMYTANDDIYATCIAINDGEETVLVYTLDVKNIGDATYNTLRLRIKVHTGVPTSNIFMSATHNHSSFAPGQALTNANLDKWNLNLHELLFEAADQAIADLSDAEMYIGSGKTTGMAWVRRYIMEDGTYTNKISTSDDWKVVGPASEADDVIQIMRFVRKDKKDVVMVNWQAHLATAIGEKQVVTSDMAHYIRRDVEAADDVLLAYFQGASGNINIEAPNRRLKKYKTHADVGVAVGKVVISNMGVDKLTRIDAGKIKVTDQTYKAEIHKDSKERIAQCKAILAEKQGTEKYNQLLAAAGFETHYGPKAVVARNSMGATTPLFLAAVSIGDFAFITAPYEMFDTNGMQVKEGSPYKMTFVLTCAGGAGAYVPSYEAMTIYGGYEVENNQYALGVAEKLVDEYLRMLNELKAAS